MNKTSRIELRRLFLLENLPAPLTRASRHLQIFDNYIERTHLRLRSIRRPEIKEWTWLFQKRELLDGATGWEISEIILSETEHDALSIFEGREISKNEKAQTNEIRKNRYFYPEKSGKRFEIDLYLGELWGLTTAKICFDSAEEMQTFETMPTFAIAEITSNEFFHGENLIGKTFADVQNEFSKLTK